MNALTPLCAPFADLACFKYISLTTYRRTGIPVSTPVWFAERAGVLYQRNRLSAPAFEAWGESRAVRRRHSVW
jgi:hypothetical protein